MLSRHSRPAVQKNHPEAILAVLATVDGDLAVLDLVLDFDLFDPQLRALHLALPVLYDNLAIKRCGPLI